MAGRPLRPATRRRLGRPLPHQQADRTRVHPPPKKLSNKKDASIAEYLVLAAVSNCYPKEEGRLLTRYSPVRRSCTPERALPLDLHVLSTPPAFVLSQDQTLRQKNIGKTNNPPTKNLKKGSPPNRQQKIRQLTKNQKLVKLLVIKGIHKPQKPEKTPANEERDQNKNAKMHWH